jgi:hypothetical protein
MILYMLRSDTDHDESVHSAFCLCSHAAECEQSLACDNCMHPEFSLASAALR